MVQQEQTQEITKLRTELVILKTKTIIGLTTMQTGDIASQAELKGVITNLES